MNADDDALGLDVACEPPRPKRYASRPTAKPTARPVMSAHTTLLFIAKRRAGGSREGGSDERPELSVSALSSGSRAGLSGALPRWRRCVGGVGMPALSH